MQTSPLQHKTGWCPCRPPARPFTAAASIKQHSRATSRSARATSTNCQHSSDNKHSEVQQGYQPVYHIAADTPSPEALSAKANAPVPLSYIAAAAGVALTFLALKKIFDTPSRAYKENVGDEYDSWTDDGVLEYYWGEHIHLGYYSGALASRCLCHYLAASDLRLGM